MTLPFQHLRLLVLTLALWVQSAPGGEEAVEPFVLNEELVVERVREQNLTLLFEREGVRRALEQMYQERASLLPSLELNASQTRSKLTRAFNSEVLDPIFVNRFAPRIVGTQTLFDVERFADYRIAQLEYSISQLDYETALQDVLSQALSLYYTQLRDLAAVELSEGTIERNVELLGLTERQFDAGVATRIDITRSEVELARARRQLLQNRTNVENSALRLKTLLDIDVNRPLFLERVPQAGMEPDPEIENGRGRLVEAGLRSEISAQQERLSQAQEARRAAQLQRLPQVEAFGEWGYDSEEAFDGDEEETWLVGIRLRIPIFEGFRISAERREALAAVRQNEYRLRDLENQIDREFEFALINLESRHDQIAIAREEERLASDELNLASERYREGLADNRELIDAQQRLDEAEDGMLNAIFLYHLSRVSFARAVGQVEEVSGGQ